MVKDNRANVMIITVISILAFSLAGVCGSMNIGNDLCDQLIPTSLTASDDTVKAIDEKNFTPTVISIKQPKVTVQKNVTKNYTNTSNTTNNTSNTSKYNSSSSNSSGSSSSSSSSSSSNGNNSS